jgi:molecular chaperone DnaK (HSP70)
MAKLRRQVRRTKEVLSANSASPLSVEELHEGRDFQSSIKREEFEALAGDYWKRVAVSLTGSVCRRAGVIKGCGSTLTAWSWRVMSLTTHTHELREGNVMAYW